MAAEPARMMSQPEARRGHEARPRRRPTGSGRRSPHGGPVSGPSPDPPIVTVFRTPEGQIHHAWCHQSLEFHGRRAGLEVDFFCLRCMEHVTLPESILQRVPVRSRLAAV